MKYCPTRLHSEYILHQQLVGVSTKAFPGNSGGKRNFSSMAESLGFSYTMTNRQKKSESFWIHLPCLAMKCFSMSWEALSMEPTLPLATLTSRWAVVQKRGNNIKLMWSFTRVNWHSPKFLPPTGMRPFQNGRRFTKPSNWFF